jgi:hypothetical protein
MREFLAKNMTIYLDAKVEHLFEWGELKRENLA